MALCYNKSYSRVSRVLGTDLHHLVQIRSDPFGYAEPTLRFVQ